MCLFSKQVSAPRTLLVVALGIEFMLDFSGAGIAKGLGLQVGSLPLVKVQAGAPVAPPRAVVLRGSSAQTEQLAALFAATGSFDVFVAAPGTGWVDKGDKVHLENSERCRADARTLPPDNMPAECIHFEPSGPLPGCRLQIDLTGPTDTQAVAQRARIYVIAEHDEACPFFDRLENPASPPGVGGKPSRPWSSLLALAELTSPTPQSILRAIGVEPSANSH